ncbi:long-chain fatty acid--CoA ligase [Fictibacillus enclensis]|uniref:long-chain-fatty-acid--CoA ligase n=1 Tax=Fictibacillus enclensis TaxID=1017270 RepID=UPI0025A11452|nr:long-chain fatty acid--CoA ligase [Fictibacillus enclensis]MDM5199208.1 long-chain fatty acid--CoA ligase [Fictibacillus enclensis]
MSEVNTWKSHYPKTIQPEIQIPEYTIPQLLEHTAEKYPDNIALSFFGHKSTYKELQNLVHRFASALQKEGLKEGDRVAVMLPNCPQYTIAYYGILAAGGIVTQVNPMLVERELLHIIEDSGAEMMIVYETLVDQVNKVEQLFSLKTVISVSFDHQPKLQDVPSFYQFLQKGDLPFQRIPVSPDETAVLQYTGGTTGRSKGAMLTHRNLVANVLQSYEFFKLTLEIGKEKYLTVIPLFHVFGMTSCMNMAVYTASESILLPRFDLEEVLETIKNEQPTVFPGVPTMYVAITNHPLAENYSIDSIKVCNSGSAPMPVELLQEFERKTGSAILEGYGLSEASPTTHCNPLFADRKAGSVGIGLPSTDYRVVDLGSGTKEVETGELGELIIKGPQVMKGYWNMPEETEHALRDGWLYTGDIAKIDEDGYVYIMDRKKDLIIASGYNVYPREVEEVLYEHPAVREAVVIGVPDPYRGEEVKAILVLKEGRGATEEEIFHYCKQNLSAYKVPHLIEFRSELPKTNVGKILRRALRDEARIQANQ